MFGRVLRGCRTFARWLWNMLFTENFVYRNIRPGQENAYQACFLQILNRIDLENLSAREKGKSFDAKSAHKDQEAISEIMGQAETVHHLSPVILQIMLEQYLLADPVLREGDRDCWVNTVRRKSCTYFPDSRAVYQVLYKE